MREHKKKPEAKLRIIHIALAALLMVALLSVSLLAFAACNTGNGGEASTSGTAADASADAGADTGGGEASATTTAAQAATTTKAATTASTAGEKEEATTASATTAATTAATTTTTETTTTAPTPPPEPLEGPMEVHALWHDLSDARYATLAASLASAGGAVQTTVVNTDAGGDREQLIADLKAALAAGATVFAVRALDQGVADEALVLCKEQNARVLFIEVAPSLDALKGYAYAWYAGESPEETGRLGAQAFLAYWSANKSVADKNSDEYVQAVFLKAEQGDPLEEIHTSTVMNNLAKSEVYMEIMSDESAGNDRAFAEEIADSWLESFGAEGVEAVFCSTDEMAMGLLAACDKLGLNKSGAGASKQYIPIVGVWGDVEALNAVSNGRMLATTTLDASALVSATLSALRAGAGGVSVLTTELVDTPNVIVNNGGFSAELAGRFVWIPGAQVTKANAAQAIAAAGGR